jgi:arginase family enzyme
MDGMNLVPIILNFDDSVAAEAGIATKASEIIDLTALRDGLRLCASPRAWEELREALRALRVKYPKPWLTFLGSGDFHHIALALIESLPRAGPFHLILIDNHPDWFYERPTFHCGNWVSGALEYVAGATLIGQDSGDLKGYRFRVAPFEHLCNGRLSIYPQARESVFVPFKWPTKTPDPFSAGSPPDKESGVFVSTGRFGTRLKFETVAAHGAQSIFEKVARDFFSRDIYLSIDKDVLRAADAVTDWEQGRLSLPELTAGIRAICASCNVIGADICGDRSPHPLSGVRKRLDARRWSVFSNPKAAKINELANLSIFSALDGQVAPPAPLRSA